MLTVFGTRPEVVKLAPVLSALRERPGLRAVTVASHQQADLLPAFLQSFSVDVDHHLGTTAADRTLNGLLAQVVESLDPILDTVAPDMVVVQGDTTTVLAGAVAARMRGIPVAHVEAGLRTGDPDNPFPEESNRRLISAATSLHCAATPGNVQTLIAEGVAPEAISLTGNPVVDSLNRMLAADRPSPAAQALLYEPIERALAAPAGRGNGDIADDIYALAVTLVVLLAGRNPVAQMSDDELLAAKIERGSYAAIAERERMPMALIEPLRGMLNDEPAERWGVDEIELWLSGRRVAPTRKRTIKQASMPLSFASYEHVTRTTLARAMAQNVREAATFARQGHLEPWLMRHMNDQAVADAVNEVVEGSNAYEGDLRGSDDVMVARLTIILDPAGPIRYKGFSFVIEGFGSAFAVSWLRDGDTKTPSEAMSLGLPGLWFAAQSGSKPGFGALDRMFAQLRAFLQSPGPGLGFERCLYETNPALPCQSPLVSSRYITKIRELMPALDEAAGGASAGSRPMDRHLAAFIAARFNQDIEAHLSAIAEPREDKELIGILSLLALLQWRLKVPPLFGLSSWIGGMLGPAINTYHNRETRREIEREIPRLVRQGSLPELYDLIENGERRRQDREGYAVATAEFTAAETEI